MREMKAKDISAFHFAETLKSVEAIATGTWKNGECSKALLHKVNLIRQIQESDPAEAMTLCFELGFSLGEGIEQFRLMDLAIRGNRSFTSFLEERNRRNAASRDAAKPRRERWKGDAKECWRKHPSWGALKVAESIAHKGESPETIRKIISPFRPGKQ